MPLVFCGLTAAVGALGEESVLVELLGLFGRDDRDLVVLAAVFAGGIGDGVDVQTRRRGFAGELA